MRVVLQRTGGVEVWVDDRLHSRSGPGLLVLHGSRTGDCAASCSYLAEKIVNLRIFEDEVGKMNRSALEVGAELMVVSQFTLYADTRKGRRPAFTEALEPVVAARLYELLIAELRTSGLPVATGQFGAKMDLRFSNHGPVTIILDHDV